MYLSQDKTFRCMASVEGYKTKDAAISSFSRITVSEYNKTHDDKIHQIGYVYGEYTVDVFIDKLINGHSVIPGILNIVCYTEDNINYYAEDKRGNYSKVFWTNGKYKGSIRHKFRTNENVESVQMLAIDIDKDNHDDIDTLVSKLTFKPTCGHYTFSDNLINRRIRLYYIFRDAINIKEDDYKFKQLVDAITYMFEFETGIKIDTSAKNPAQVMSGTNKPWTYKSYMFYTYKDFATVIENRKNETSSAALFNPHTIFYWDPDVVRDVEKILFGMHGGFQSVKEIYQKYNDSKYKIYYRVENSNWIESNKYPGIYWQFTDEDYFKLMKLNQKLQPGHGMRHKFMLSRTGLRKLHNADPNELLLNAALDVVLNINNSDKKYNVENLKSIVYSVMRTDNEKIISSNREYIEMYSKSRIIVHWVSKSYLEENNLTYKGIVQTCIKESKMYQAKEIYNPLLSVKKNLEIINSNLDFNISERTLKNYIKEWNEESCNNISERDQIILNMINDNFKQKEIISKLKDEYDIKISISTLKRLKNKYLK